MPLCLRLYSNQYSLDGQCDVHLAFRYLLIFDVIIYKSLIFWTGVILPSFSKLVLLYCPGPAFIKWGQWASTRPDIFPADICDELSRLHMQVCEIRI